MCKYDSVQIVKYHIIIISLEFIWARVKIENILPQTQILYFLFLFQAVWVRARRRTGSRTWWRGRTWCSSAASPLASAQAPAPFTGSGHPTTTTTTWPSGRRPSAPDTREYSTHLASYWSLGAALSLAVFRQHLSFRDKVLQDAICVEIQAVRMNCKEP